MSGMLRGPLTAILIVAIVSGCATSGGSSGTCALIGGALGAGAGVIVANNETEDETDENLVAGGIGLLTGSLLGYLVCPAEPIPPRVSANSTPAVGEPPLRAQLGANATDEDGKIVSYAWDFGDGTKGTGAATSHTYARPGRYAARVTVTDDDGLTASATTNIDVADVAAAPPSRPQQRIVLQGITFPFDSAEISEADAPLLDVAAEQLAANPDVRVRVVGHTDSVGADEYNQNLSERRASAVLGYLTKNGVAPTRLEASGAGESQPVASNDTSDGRAQNRRVELLIKE